MNLPLVNGANVRECRPLCRRAEAEEQETVSGSSAVAVKVGDQVTIGFTGLKLEDIIAAIADQKVEIATRGEGMTDS